MSAFTKKKKEKKDFLKRKWEYGRKQNNQLLFHF